MESSKEVDSPESTITWSSHAPEAESADRNHLLLVFWDYSSSYASSCSSTSWSLPPPVLLRHRLLLHDASADSPVSTRYFPALAIACIPRVIGRSECDIGVYLRLMAAGAIFISHQEFISNQELDTSMSSMKRWVPGLKKNKERRRG